MSRRKTLDQRVADIAAKAIEETQAEVADAVAIRFGNPTHRLVGELGVYARHLRTWTCDEESIGEVRPLRDLLNDAALHITVTANLQEAAEKSA